MRHTSLLLFGEGGAVKDPVSEKFEVANAKRDALNNFDLVVTALREAVSIVAIKGIQDFISPVMYSIGTGVKLV